MTSFNQYECVVTIKRYFATQNFVNYTRLLDMRPFLPITTIQICLLTKSGLIILRNTQLTLWKLQKFVYFLPKTGHTDYIRSLIPGKSSQWLQLHTPRPMVGPGHHDHCRLRRHGSEDVSRHVRWHPVRSRRCTDRRPARSGHRLQLRDVLLAHAGPRKAAQETKACSQRWPASDKQAGRAARSARWWGPGQGQNGSKNG